MVQPSKPCSVDLALLAIDQSQDAPRYLTVSKAQVSEAQAVAPTSVLAYFPDALMDLGGSRLVDLAAQPYGPDGPGQLPFAARDELNQMIGRAGLEAHDFGCATLAERQVLRHSPRSSPG
ncbi:protein of unknown function [Hyphomicrobium sp. 1Nfss2.1]